MTKKIIVSLLLSLVVCFSLAAIPVMAASGGHVDSAEYNEQRGVVNFTVSGLEPDTLYNISVRPLIAGKTGKDAVDTPIAFWTMKSDENGEIESTGVQVIDGSLTGDVAGNTSGYAVALYSFPKGEYIHHLAFEVETSEDTVKKPVISPAKKTVTSTAAIEVTITCGTEGATIYYTTDGTDPTADSEEYNAPFSVTPTAAGVTVKAFAVKDGMNDSDIAAVTYTYSTGGGGGGGGGGSTATVTKTGTTNGSYTLSSTTATAGDTVKITPKANSGYEVDTVTATDKNGNAIAVTKNADGTYSFTMPAADLLPVKTAVTFKQSEGSTPTPPPSKTGFVDVDDSAYYADAVAWAIAHDPVITNGTDSTHFSPDASCTRAQMVTFLWRAAGQPAPAAEAPFTDVAADAYYAQAVAWAYASGITKGTSETEFSPDATVTRAQVVTLLYRYEQASATGGANQFTDVAEGAYYYDAVLWANANNITNGTSATTFSPDSDCTRAQIVTFLYRAMA